MRNIDQIIKDRLQLPQQTAYNNAQPQMEVIAIRPRTPIFRANFWQESVVSEGVTAVCTSVAIRRTSRWGDTIFVAYVDDSGDLTVKSAPFRFPIRTLSWTTLAIIPGCVACALEFEGRFVHIGSNVEFRTDAVPYLFYVTSTGALLGGILGSTYETLAGANVTAVDAINGVSNTFDAQNQGFFVFYIANGTVYYNTYLDGSWLGQESVAIAPANAVSIKAERTFDYRIVLQVKDNVGALYEIFSKMEATGWNGTDFISLGATVQAGMVDVHYSNFQNTEHISVDGSVEAWSMATYSPTLLRAWNIATSTEDPENPGTYYDDYGYRVVFEFDECIRNAELFPADFKLVDAYNVPIYGQSVQMDSRSRFVTVTFTDFNNAGNSVTATALAGNLWNGLTMLTETSKTFEPTGLVPTFIPVPVLLTAEDVDSRTIILTFDMGIANIGTTTGWAIAALEPNMQPDGVNSTKQYVVSSVGYGADNTKVSLILTPTGRMKNPIGSVSIDFSGTLIGINGQAVAPFSTAFAPQNIARVFNPNDVERINLSAAITAAVKQINYLTYQANTENIGLSATITGTVIHVNDLGQ